MFNISNKWTSWLTQWETITSNWKCKVSTSLLPDQNTTATKAVVEESEYNLKLLLWLYTNTDICKCLIYLAWGVHILGWLKANHSWLFATIAAIVIHYYMCLCDWKVEKLNMMQLR